MLSVNLAERLALPRALIGSETSLGVLMAVCRRSVRWSVIIPRAPIGGLLKNYYYWPHISVAIKTIQIEDLLFVLLENERVSEKHVQQTRHTNQP